MTEKIFTIEKLLKRIKKGNLSLTKEEAFQLYWIMDKPSENLNFTWDGKTLKTVKIKGLNVILDVKEEN